MCIELLELLLLKKPQWTEGGEMATGERIEAGKQQENLPFGNHVVALLN